MPKNEKKYETFSLLPVREIVVKNRDFSKHFSRENSDH
jgi:hypothetical protein